jgi:hypothetical protein
MDPAPLIERILDDEGLTSGLDEAEASLLLKELADRARHIAATAGDLPAARRRVEALCRSAREVARRTEEARQVGEPPASALRRLLPRLAG